MDNILDAILDNFNNYRISHPNLSHCWLSYLELKKRNYSEIDLSQCKKVLTMIENGCTDLNRNDMVRLLLYTHSIVDT